MDIVGDVEVTFGEDLRGALCVAQGAHESETQNVPRLCNMFFRSVGDTQSPLLRAIPVDGNY